MRTRYQRRVQLGGGLGLNLSKSGISASYRNRYGAIGSRGYSIRTGIPGLSFRSYKSGGRGGRRGRNNDAAAVMLTLALLGIFIVAFLVLWNLARLAGWAAVETRKAYLRWRLRREMITAGEDPDLLLAETTAGSQPTTNPQRP